MDKKTLEYAQEQLKQLRQPALSGGENMKTKKRLYAMKGAEEI